MGWIKRNLFFVIGGVLALGLLGGAIFYFIASMGDNAKSLDDLTQVVQSLQQLNDKKPSPGNEKINNVETAKEQDQQVKEWLATAGGSFTAIPPIPAGPVTGASFSGALQHTLDQLRQEAAVAGVQLPPKFAFSFTAECDRLNFATAGLPPLADQVGEVAAISRVLFAARVNALDGIQRVRVSDDDANGQPSDYIDESPQTNDLAIVQPYVVTFRTFTPELADVFSGFATGKNAFIVKSVNVVRADASGAAMPGADQPPTGMPPMMRMPGEFPQQPMPAQMPGAITTAGGKGGLQTVLKEQLIRVTLELQLVKLLPQTPKS